MEQYRAAVVREIIFRLVPPILLILIGCIGAIIFVKFIGAWQLKYSKLITVGSMFLAITICGLILFFDTKGLFADLSNNDYVEFYGEATFDSKQSNKECNSFRLNDEEKTVVTSNIGKVETTIQKCNAYVVYGRNSKFVVVFEVKEVLEERLPINIT